jgi:hypothetical protein
MFSKKKKSTHPIDRLFTSHDLGDGSLELKKNVTTLVDHGKGKKCHRG